MFKVVGVEFLNLYFGFLGLEWKDVFFYYRIWVDVAVTSIYIVMFCLV